MRRAAGQPRNAGTWLKILVPLVLYGLVVLTGVAQAQKTRTYTLRGQILSLIDGLPIPNISVYLKGTTLSAVTDSQGVFQIRRVPPGTYDLVARYPDFEATILKGIDIPPRQPRSFVFTLRPERETADLPLITPANTDSMGWLEGRVHVRIDTFRSDFESGWLELKAVVAGKLTESYVYPRRWRLLPVQEQDFRFKFFLPVGKRYHLYLVWRAERPGLIAEYLVDVARLPDNAKVVRTFDLSQSRYHPGIVITLDASRIPWQ